MLCTSWLCGDRTAYAQYEYIRFTVTAVGILKMIWSAIVLYRSSYIIIKHMPLSVRWYEKSERWLFNDCLCGSVLVRVRCEIVNWFWRCELKLLIVAKLVLQNSVVPRVFMHGISSHYVTVHLTASSLWVRACVYVNEGERERKSLNYNYKLHIFLRYLRGYSLKPKRRVDFCWWVRQSQVVSANP